MKKKIEWGWTSYRATGWIHEDGTKEYAARFRADHDPFNYTVTSITFFARHPIKALRRIAFSGRNPESFHGTEVTA